MFGHFVGLTSDGVHWSQESWHFFLHVLYCIRLLLGGARMMPRQPVTCAVEASYMCSCRRYVVSDLAPPAFSKRDALSLRSVLSGIWKTTVRQWASKTGVELPVQAVFDVIGNLFNVQVGV